MTFDFIQKDVNHSQLILWILKWFLLMEKIWLFWEKLSDLARNSFVRYFHQNKMDDRMSRISIVDDIFDLPIECFHAKRTQVLFWPSDTQTHYLWSQLRHFTLPLPLSRLTLEWISLFLQTASPYPQIFCPKGWHWQVIVTKYSLLY